MKIVETLDNPAAFQSVMRALKAAEKAKITSATVTFRTFTASVGGGRDNEPSVEIVIEGPSTLE